MDKKYVQKETAKTLFTVFNIILYIVLFLVTLLFRYPYVNYFFNGYVMISLIYEYITVSMFNVTLINIIILLFYQTISYIILCFFSYTTFNETTLLTTLYSSIIVNVIYGFLLFILVSFLDKKHKIRKMY